MKPPSAILRVGSPRRQSLGAELADRLAGEIRSGTYAAGDKLPSEIELISAAAVSRAVVREAFSALRASGLIETRQGIGAFVTDGPMPHAFRLDPRDLRNLDQVLDVLELRMGVEVEAVALAAERHTGEQMAAIHGALDEIDSLVDRGEPAVAADFKLHHTIAQATGNRSFADFIQFFGPVVIPRQTVNVRFRSAKEQIQYLQMIQGEHRRIVEAISVRDAVAARDAMRVHLVDGRERYRQLQLKSQASDA